MSSCSPFPILTSEDPMLAQRCSVKYSPKPRIPLTQSGSKLDSKQQPGSTGCFWAFFQVLHYEIKSPFFGARQCNCLAVFRVKVTNTFCASGNVKTEENITHLDIHYVTRYCTLNICILKIMALLLPAARSPLLILVQRRGHHWSSTGVTPNT